MRWAKRSLDGRGYNPKDKHKTESYDFLCRARGDCLYVEVKGTQDDGSSVSLTPKEVEHAKRYRNSALIIIHSVKVKGKRKPKVSRGKELFLDPWNIEDGILKPRGFVFTHAKAPTKSHTELGSHPLE